MMIAMKIITISHLVIKSIYDKDKEHIQNKKIQEAKKLMNGNLVMKNKEEKKNLLSSASIMIKFQ